MENNRQNSTNINWGIGINGKQSLKPLYIMVCLK